MNMLWLVTKFYYGDQGRRCGITPCYIGKTAEDAEQWKSTHPLEREWNYTVDTVPSNLPTTISQINEG